MEFIKTCGTPYWSSWDRIDISEYGLNGEFGNTFYFSVTVDGSKNELNFFLDGKKVANGNWRPEDNMWTSFIDKINTNKPNTITVGRSRSAINGGFGFMNAEAYCFRIYGRPLTDTEVKKNYEKTVLYHSLLENK